MSMVEEQRSAARVYSGSARWAPPPALTGFVLLLVTVFVVSFGVGRAAGPVAPGMHSNSNGSGSRGDSAPHGAGGTGGAHPGGTR
ncbi:hypothetical protein ACFVGY_03980 [Streptomyces sp. NPDC127106]|uniref:hypothetical protein n=1 Tax=Streptomyces sp. NPDC127106 TaxID=3345360 RepID=UPI00363B2145